MNSESAQGPQSQGKPDAPGAQLKAQREAMGWSVEQVAEQLKLAPRQVIALEQGDTAALPNMAVVRGFIRAYAKVVKLDAAPLVAMIEVKSIAAAPARRDIPAKFSKPRFPSMTQRTPMRKSWIAGAVLLVLAAGAFVAYQKGLIAPVMLMRGDKDVLQTVKSLAPPGSGDAALAKPGLELTPLQTLSVPLISVPPVAGAAPAMPSPVAGAAGATPQPVQAGAAVADNVLVLTVRQDSWIELRRVGAAPLIARTVKAGTSESFKIAESMLLIVGKPAGVTATLRGVALDLTPAPGASSSRVAVQ